jgi:hypothetical protein
LAHQLAGTEDCLSLCRGKIGDPSGSRMRWTPSRTWKKNSGIPVAPPTRRYQRKQIHDLSSQPRRGRLPRHACASPVFARCAPATSVPRKSDHRREAAAALEWQRPSPPGRPPQGAGIAAGTAAQTHNPTVSSCVGHEISVRKCTVLLGRAAARSPSRCHRHSSPALTW